MRLACKNTRMHPSRVNKLCIFVGVSLFSYGGWFLGAALGFEFFGSFLLSGLGSLVGVWAGWKVAQRLR